MGLTDENLKYKFLLIRGDAKSKTLLEEAIKLYIEKRTQDLTMYSKGRNDQDRVKVAADDIQVLMEMRDNIERIGSDKYYSARDFEYPVQKIL